MSELDLTKPLRIKHSQERFYPCPDLTNDRWLHGLCLGFETGPIGMPKVQKFLPATVHRGELENIPDPIVRYRALYLCADGNISTIKSVSEDFNDSGGLRKTGYAIIKLTRTEDGKTQVEVCDD